MSSKKRTLSNCRNVRSDSSSRPLPSFLYEPLRPFWSSFRHVFFFGCAKLKWFNVPTLFGPQRPNLCTRHQIVLPLSTCLNYIAIISSIFFNNFDYRNKWFIVFHFPCIDSRHLPPSLLRFLIEWFNCRSRLSVFGYLVLISGLELPCTDYWSETTLYWALVWSYPVLIIGLELPCSDYRSGATQYWLLVWSYPALISTSKCVLDSVPRWLDKFFNLLTITSLGDCIIIYIST